MYKLVKRFNLTVFPTPTKGVNIQVAASPLSQSHCLPSLAITVILHYYFTLTSSLLDDQ